MERTFLIVKPDGVNRGLVGEVLARWEKKGFKLVGLKFITAARNVVEEHYAEHKGKGFYEGLVNFLTSGPIAVMVWEGKGVIASSRLLIGATNPLTAAPGTVRGDFGIDVGRNIIHGSDAPESAAREIGLWFKEDELQNWTPRSQPDVYEKI